MRCLEGIGLGGLGEERESTKSDCAASNWGVNPDTKQGLDFYLVILLCRFVH